MKTSLRPEGWDLVTLSDIAAEDYGLVDGPFGSSLPASEYVESGIPVIRGSNLTLGVGFFNSDEFVFVSEETAQRLSRSLCFPKDIIFTKKGTLGQTGIVPDDRRYKKYLLSSNQMKLTVNRRIAEPLFVYYYVSSPQSREKFIKDSEATGVPKTNLEYLRAFPILLPPLSEQRAIAHILGTLDDKIELNRRMNATLEAIARAIFKSWFVDFDPVHAKARGEQPAGMNAATAALFPDAFEDSELGPIPAGWGVKKVGEIVELQKSNIQPQNFPAELFNYYSLPAFDSGKMPVKEIGENILSNKALIPDGCVLLSKLNPVFPKVWLPYRVPGYRSISSTEFLVILPKPSSTREFLYFLFCSERFLAEFGNLVTGTSSSHQRVKPADFLAMKMAFPKQPTIQQFTGFVVPILNKIWANQQQSLLLAEIRDALLPKLISGKIRVGEYNDAITS